MAHQDILTRLAAYCDETGLSPATVCGRATGNARLHHRLSRRLKKLEQDCETLTAFMDANPPLSQPARGK